MQCMILEEFKAPLVLREREIPSPGEGEAVVKVGATGVCQTDIKIWQGKHPAVRKLPIVPGHEVAGEIVEVGRGVDKSHIGKHVVVFSYHVCGECRYCQEGRESLCSNLKGQIGFNIDGGYAEYLKAPADCLIIISKDIPFEKAAILTDAVATPYHALTSKAKTKPGETVAIIGTGGLGLHAVQIAKMLGARVIAIDISEQALVVAQKMGAEWTIKVPKDGLTKKIIDLSEGRGVDTVVDFTGNPRMEMLALEILKVAGRFVLVAYDSNNPFQVNSQLMVSKELEIYGARWCGRGEFKKCIDLVSSSKVEPFVGEVHPLIEANSILKRLQKGEILGRAVLVP